MSLLQAGKIYDNNSIDKFITHFGSMFKDQQVRFLDRTVFGEGEDRVVYDADTVASNGVFLEQQLRQIMPLILKQVYPNLVGLDVMSGKVDNSGTYMQAIIQRIQSYQGDFVDANELSDDKGLLTFSRDGKVVDIRTKKGYSVYDNITAERARVLGENIDASLIETHNIKYKQFIDKMIFLGMTDSRGTSLTEGLANYSSYATGLRLDADSTFAAYAAAKDGLGMYGEIAKLYNAMIGAAAGASQFYPDTIVIPPTQFAIMASTPIVVAGGNGVAMDTVLTYTERNLGVKVYGSKWVIGQGDSSSDRLIMFAAKENANPNATLYIPMPLQFLPIFIKAGDYHITSQFRVAGVSINFNNSIAYLDKI